MNTEHGAPDAAPRQRPPGGGFVASGAEPGAAEPGGPVAPRDVEPGGPVAPGDVASGAPAVPGGGAVAPGDDELEVGVGPWAGPWPTDPRFDPELLAGGDRRNVVDRYRYWRHEAIVADLDTRRHDFHVAIENWQHDFNIGTVVRTANAFLAGEVHIVGRRRWNRRGAMVTDRYQHVRHHDTIEGFAAWAHGAGLVVIGIDNLPGSRPLETTTLPRRCVLLFGQEGPGLSEAARAACDQMYSIAQYGSTRSINAGVASAVAMHAWIRAYGGPPPA